MISILYATHDGHTRKIVERMELQLYLHGQEAELIDLAKREPTMEELAPYRMIVLVAPIRYGWHLPAVDRFIKKNKNELASHQLAVISINLTARKSGKDTGETNPYLRKWLRRLKIEPDLRAAFAGRLEYRLYRWWEIMMIRLIMKITGGPTHLDAAIDFTDWDKVDAFAQQLIAFRQQAKARAA